MAKSVVLRDGTPAWIWPLTPTDARGLQAGFRQLTPESRYNRFLSALGDLPEPLLRVLVDEVDGVDHVALVLVALPDDGPDQAAGVGRLIRYPDNPTAADVAVTVDDEWQGRGVGSALLAELVEQRPVGVDELLTYVAADNRASLAMLARLGPLRSAPFGPGVREVRVQLTKASVEHGQLHDGAGR